jgi:hypothetical protein
VKTVILPKEIYMLNTIPIKILMTFCTGKGKIHPEIHRETQKTSNSQRNSELKSNSGGIIITNFKQYYRAITIKTNNMVLAQKQTGRPMSWNKKHRHKPMHLQETGLQQKSPKHIMEKR